MTDPRNEARGCWIFLFVLLAAALLYFGKTILVPMFRSGYGSASSKAEELKELQRLADEGAKHPTPPKPTVTPTPPRPH